MLNLETLEFSECVIDSPEFREKLVHHESAIDSSYKILKEIHACMKNVYKTLEDCSNAYQALGNVLKNYKSEQDKLINTEQSEDEKLIKAALSMYSVSLESIETMRNEHILGETKKLIFEDIQNLKDNCLAKSRNEIKEFKKTTSTYYQKLEKYTAIKGKSDNDYMTVDSEIHEERKQYASKAMDHVMNIQQTQEEKTYRLVHTLSLFIQMLNTYHHQAWDHFCDQKKKMDDINCALFRTGEKNKDINQRTLSLKEELLSIPIEHIQKRSGPNSEARREGYLYIQTKKKHNWLKYGKVIKKNVVSDIWTRSFCVYEKQSRRLTITPFSQLNNTPGAKEHVTEELILESCERRKSSSIDRRFCFDIRIKNRSTSLTLQALSKEDLNLWLSIMDGKEPVYAKPVVQGTTESETYLNARGHKFIHMCILEVEKRGLESPGIYRCSGRALYIDKYMNRIRQDLRKSQTKDLILPKELDELEINTICSLIKAFLKHLNEPLATFNLYQEFINAGKQPDADKKYQCVKEAVKKLPQLNYQLLALLIKHLNKVTSNQEVNLMTAPNLGMCFSPTIFRSEDTTSSLTSIRESKFAGDVISLMIERCDDFFSTPSLPADFSSISSSSGGAATTANLQSGSVSTKSRLYGTKSVYVPKSPNPSLLPGVDSGDTNSELKPVTPVNISTSNSNTNISNNSDYPLINTRKQRDHKSPLRRNRTDIYTANRSNNQKNNNNDNNNNTNTNAHNNHYDSSKPPPILIAKPDTTRHRITSSAPSTPEFSQVKRTLPKARTLYLYIADGDEQLSFDPNKIVTNVIDTDNNGWLIGTIDGREGFIPKSYVEILPS